MEFRKIEKVFMGEDKKEGAGVKIKRIFDRKNTKELDPFLMMDFFDTREADDYKGGFPWHPHRGIETITYLIRGEVYHEDTLGHKGSIGDGECQWMVSGNGIMHQELMIESEELLGVQIWLNMAKDEKMKNPSYRDIRNISSIEDGGDVRVLSGKYKDEEGDILRNDRINPTIIDVSLEENSEFIYDCNRDYTLFLFILDGGASLDGEVLSKGQGILYEKGKEDKIKIKSREKGLRCLILSGRPLNEPIAWEGPIAMNTKEELDLAFDELNKQEFIKFRG